LWSTGQLLSSAAGCFCRPRPPAAAQINAPEKALSRQEAGANILVDKRVALLYLVFIDFSWNLFFMKELKKRPEAVII